MDQDLELGLASGRVVVAPFAEAPVSSDLSSGSGQQ
ncbi:hypothetical protein PI125_g12741 [Phytophthora idaei]|nr:hypothetical protein PI125_g12741 [Phytophthora idaei]